MARKESNPSKSDLLVGCITETPHCQVLVQLVEFELESKRYIILLEKTRDIFSATSTHVAMCESVHPAPFVEIEEAILVPEVLQVVKCSLLILYR